jgi:anti-sigma factor RsiW
MSRLPRHKLAELTAYVYGEGTPKERAAFEKHLAECPDCPGDLERLRKLLPLAHELLRQPLDTSIDAMMRLMDRAERDLLAERAALRERKAKRRPWIIAATTLALATTAAVLLLSQMREPETTAGPIPPVVDGGSDGGDRGVRR